MRNPGKKSEPGKRRNPSDGSEPGNMRNPKYTSGPLSKSNPDKESENPTIAGYCRKERER